MHQDNFWKKYWVAVAVILLIILLVVGVVLLLMKVNQESARDVTDYSTVKAPPSSVEKFVFDEFADGVEVLSFQESTATLLGTDDAGEVIAVGGVGADGETLELWDTNTKQKRAEVQARSCTKTIDKKYVYCETDGHGVWESIDVATGEKIFVVSRSDVASIEPLGSKDGLHYLKVEIYEHASELLVLSESGEERWKKELISEEKCNVVVAEPVVFCGKPFRDPNDMTAPNYRASVFSASDGSVKWEQDVVGSPKVFSDGWVASLTPRPNIEFSVFDFNNQKIDMQWLSKSFGIVPHSYSQYDIYDVQHTFPVRPLEKIDDRKKVVFDGEGNVAFHAKYESSSFDGDFVKPGEDEVRFSTPSVGEVVSVSRKGRLVLFLPGKGEVDKGKRVVLKDTETGSYIIDLEAAPERRVAVENGIIGVVTSGDFGEDAKLDVYYPRG
ncbi:MAG: hypothetical protein Q4A92_09360 [Corynebacterium sp.]|nr:hypothetical protein [Corynebacterium sp.]